jgi:hypothetical protein
MQVAPKLLDVKIIFPLVLSALSASLRENYMGCYCFFILNSPSTIQPTAAPNTSTQARQLQEKARTAPP